MESFLLIWLNKILADIFMPSIGGIAGIELLKKQTKEILICNNSLHLGIDT